MAPPNGFARLSATRAAIVTPAAAGRKALRLRHLLALIGTILAMPIVAVLVLASLGDRGRR